LDRTPLLEKSVAENFAPLLKTSMAQLERGTFEVRFGYVDAYPLTVSLRNFSLKISSPPGEYVCGGLQMQIDVGIGPAGDVWATNNWNDHEAALGQVAKPNSTLGGGQGRRGVWYGKTRQDAPNRSGAAAVMELQRFSR
jgi:hypothetical protein